MLITTSIIAMENFLSNNVLFEDTDDAITFINNVKREPHKFNILDYVDEPVSREELLFYLLNHKKPGQILDQTIIKEFINALDTETATRIYYKNQILKLLENDYFKTKLNKMLQFTYTDKIAPEMENDLEDLKAKLMEFCLYDYLIEDRYKRSMKDKRKSIITIDTDSNFINIDKYITTITDSLLLDKTNKQQQLTLLNIFINITTEALKRTFWTLTTNMNLVDEAKPLINMKQEFLYDKILLTNNKKNYAGIITAELGKALEHPVLDVKGLPILKKTSVPKALRKQFLSIVENDILKADEINLKRIIEKYDEVEMQIEESLKNGEVQYLLPKNLELIENYKQPDTIEPIRATLVWNACEPENQINPPEKINMIKLNCTSPDDPRLQQVLKQQYPDKYEAIMKTVFNYNTPNPKIDISRFGLSCIAIPKGEEKIPEYMRPFIDIKTMVNTNMQPSYILLESLGIYCDTVKTTKYKSNIISL